MTTVESMQLIGKTFGVTFDGLVFDVKVTDCKRAYGQTRVLITPANSHAKHAGSKWIMADRLMVSTQA